ncbi:diphthine--ammonia ligase [Fukomys damarensis]|uniref:diphthine--ammonia ligase n=1 Tax=Fukomys damarensis TaxID=885580 RepID=UPI0008FEC760|nr:diphthine--ammonia ligase [Fukomys damarensis]
MDVAFTLPPSLCLCLGPQVEEISSLVGDTELYCFRLELFQLLLVHGHNCFCDLRGSLEVSTFNFLTGVRKNTQYGGKDSCYNMMQCIAAGHKIVALANLRPDENRERTDELDSYMYQTVGHQAIDLYAEAMALPLYRRTIRGRSLDTGKEYTKCEGDEVEDLYELLKLVKENEEVDGISVGAILSDYQRVRVENVCKRLNLQPLAYLWQRNQEDLLREMIASNIQAVIIKVAAMGLDPDKHLGKSLDEMEPYLLELSKKYGVHVCGEGGEYETFTLDCPLFKKKIIVDSSEIVIHSADAFAPVAYLRFLELHLEDKVSTVSDKYKTCSSIHNS